MNNVNMANMAAMGAMGGPVGNQMAMMNNGAIAQQGGPRQPPANEATRTSLNTYIYEYFLRYEMYDCARAILSPEHQVKVHKDDGRRDENGNLIGNGLGGDAMDTDSKDDVDSKRPGDLPSPVVPVPLPDSCFLFEWFCLFWDMFNAQKGKGANGPVNQYVNHTQAQSRMRQAQQQDMLRQMRPDFSQQQQFQLMRNMQNGAMMNMKPGNNLPRTAMANSQNNPQAMQMLQQKQGQMQREPSDMDGNRQRPSSPGSTDNAPSPSKRPRLDGGPFNPAQAAMMPNGRPVGQGMPGQQVGNGPQNPQQVQQMLINNGINPHTLNPEQIQTFQNQSPAVQAKTIATYAANLQQHHNNQLPTKPMPNATGPQPQGSPMIPQGPDGTAALTAYYNAADMAGPGGMRPVPGGAQAGGGSNHALQDYQMQLMLLEQQNKKRLMMARQEQDGMATLTRADGGPTGPGAPGAPPGPNAQQFQGTSPQGGRTGASPNPTEQMKRNNQHMGNAGIGSPLPENPQSRGSPSAMNFMAAGAAIDTNTAPNFFKGVENNMIAAQLNGGMRPPSSHPGPPFNGQMNQQQIMAARQQAAQQQGGQGAPQMQWQQSGPNGNQMGPQGPQGQQVQGTPQRAMPPPSAPAAGNTNQRNQTASPQTSNAAPPTPQQSTKANPKKKDSKAAKSKTAAQKKSATNLNAGATPAAEAPAEPEVPTPATPITPVNPASFSKAGQNATAAPVAPNGQATPAPPAATAVPPAPPADATQNTFAMDGSMDFGLDFANPLVSDNVLNDFDFDSFLHEDTNDATAFDFATGGFGIGDTGEIGAE